MKKGTSIIFINNADQILLFKRDDKDGIPFPGYWDVLGGHVEEGETPEECIIREMDEEIGLELENPRLFNRKNSPMLASGSNNFQLMV